MDPRASELSTIIAEPPLASGEITRVIAALRAVREQGVPDTERTAWCELAQNVGLWAEKAQLGADAAAVLAELGNLAASRLGDGTLAAAQYVRSLELAPTDFSVSERATLHLRRLGATSSLAHVLKEHARVLDGMPWIDEQVRASAWKRLAQFRPDTGAGPRASRREDTPTTPHARRVGFVPPEPMPLTTSASRSVAPPRGQRLVRSVLGAALVLAVVIAFVGDATERTGVRADTITRAAAVTASDLESKPPVAPAPPATPRPKPAVLPPEPAPEAQQVVRVQASLARASVRVHEALLGRRDVVRAVGPALEEVEGCAGLFAAGTAPTLEVTWLVRPSGRIERVLLREQPAGLPERARSCVVEALRSVRFPRADREVMRVRGTIVMASGV